MPALPRRRSMRILQAENGTSAVEFGFLAPLLGLMLVGIADLAQGYSERFALETAAHRALERASIGTTQSVGSTDYSFLRAEAATAARVPLSNVNYRSWLECDGTQKAFDDVCEEGQQIARYVEIEIWKNFVPSFDWTGSSTIRIAGQAAVRIQ
jgi:hypothetical protein